MNHDLNIAILGKLTSTYPDAADRLDTRAGQIFDERIKQREKEAFNRGVDTALAPLTLRFWKSALDGMGRIFDDAAHIMAGSPPPKRMITSSPDESWKAVGRSIDWAAENYFFAACDYIKEQNVPLTLFTQTERNYIDKGMNRFAEPSQKPDPAP